MQKQTGIMQENVQGIVDRVTSHNPESGWAVLKVSPFANPHQQETVIVHQTRVFAGVTVEFRGTWIFHKKFGRQFQAIEAIEKKPAMRECSRSRLYEIIDLKGFWLP